MSLAQADTHVEKTKAYMSKKIAQMKDSKRTLMLNNIP